MKDIRKGSILYGGVVRGRRKFLIINIVITILYILYMVNAMPYIVGKLHGPYDFDADKFVSVTENITFTEEIKMKKRADKSIPSGAYKELSYFDGDKYRFNVKFDSVEDVGIEYTAQIEDPTTKEMVEYVLYSLCIGRIGDKSVPVLLVGDTVANTADTYAGIFVKPADVIKWDISKLTADGTPVTVSEYMLDCRNIEMGVEEFDVFVMIFGFILLAFLYIRLIRYYVNPYLHPTYKQLYKYGELEEVINDIEDQFESDEVYRDGKELVCVDWIMTKEPFKIKIAKNHRTSGRYS